jgi:hypothetical protein
MTVTDQIYLAALVQLKAEQVSRREQWLADTQKAA